MSPAIGRFIRREGRRATIRSFSPTGTDDYNDPTDPGESVQDTRGLVESLRSPTTIVTAAGEEVVVDTRVAVPDDVTIRPDEDARRPQVEVGRHAYKIWAVDEEGPLPGAFNLLVTRFGLTNIEHTNEFTTEFA